MAWTNTSSTVSTVNSGTTEIDLSNMTSTTGVTKTFNGSIPQYSPGSNVTINVAGDLTINPEENSLASNANRIITVLSGGILRVGAEVTSPIDGSTRKTIGLAITSTRAQNSWFGGSTGNDCSIVIQSGGTIIFKGATTKFSGMYGFLAGAHVWIDGLIHYCLDYSVGDGTIDPQSGVAVTNANEFINTGVANRLTLAGRGLIGWQVASDIRVDDWTLIGGGEFAFAREFGASVNTLSGTANGFFGYSSVGARAPVLIDQQLANLDGNPSFSAKNIALANAGNLKSIALQSNNNGSTRGEAYITNALNGTEMTIGSDKLVSDARNWGYGTLGRDINVDIRDGLTGAAIAGGAFFYRDYETNGSVYRLNLNTHNNTADKTFIGALTSGALAADHEVILKIVNVVAGAKKGGTSNDIRGINRSFDITRTSATVLTYDPSDFGAAETTDVFNFYITTTGDVTTTASITPTAAQTAFSVTTNSDDTIVCRIKKAFNTVFDGDLRTKSGIEGEDTFDFVYWNPAYNPVFFTDFNLTDNTFGTIVLSANTLPNNDYSDTSSSEDTSDNVDKLYDHILQRKADATEAFATGIEYPTAITFAVEKTNNLLDIGSRTFAIATNLSNQYSLTNDAVIAHTTSFGVGVTFFGITTTSSIDLDDINITSTMILTAPTMTNMGTVGGLINYTNNNATSNNVSILATGIVDSGSATTTITGTFTSVTDDTGLEPVVGATKGTYTVSGVIAIGGKHTGPMTSNASSGACSVSGEITGDYTVNTSGVTTISGKVGGEAYAAGTGSLNVTSTAMITGNLVADSETATHTVAGTVGGEVQIESTGRLTFSGTATGVSYTEGPITSTGTFNAGFTAGDGDSNVAGVISAIGIEGGGLSLDDGDSTVSATITGRLDVGDGDLTFSGSVSDITLIGTGSHTLSGTATGALTTTGTITSSIFFAAGTTVTAGNGASNVSGNLGGKLTLGTGAHTVGATITSGGIGTTGTLSVSGNITGAVASTATTGVNSVSGTLSTTLTTASSGRLTVSGTIGGLASNLNGPVTTTSVATLTGGITAGAGDSVLDGTFVGAVIVGVGNATVKGSYSSTVTLGNGNHTIDVTSMTDLLTLNNGNSTLDGSFEDITDGTGTLVFASGASMTGTLTKNGSGNTNSLTGTSAQAANITLVVSSGTLELFGWSRADFAGVTGLTSNNEAPTTTTITIPSSYPTGKYIIELSSAADSTSKTVSTFTTGSDLEILNITNPGSTATYRIYYKATDVVTGDEDTSFIYQPVFQSVSTSGSDQSFNVEAPKIDPNLLTALAEEASTGTELATLTFDGSSKVLGLMNISGATTAAGLSSSRTQKMLLNLRNSDNYLRLLSNRDADTDIIINPGSNQATVIDNDIIKFDATDQQYITAVDGLNSSVALSKDIVTTTPAKTFVAVVVIPNTAGATSVQIADAVNNSATGERVKEMRGNDLLGLAPQDDDNN